MCYYLTSTLFSVSSKYCIMGLYNMIDESDVLIHQTYSYIFSVDFFMIGLATVVQYCNYVIIYML